MESRRCLPELNDYNIVHSQINIIESITMHSCFAPMLLSFIEQLL